MRTIIAGSRDNVTQDIVDKAIVDSGWSDIITVVISGTARGADRMGENWAKRKGVAIDSKPADWDTHGKSAGYKRNQEMAEGADALIAIWDGKSRGTSHMIEIAKGKKIPTFVYRLDLECGFCSNGGESLTLKFKNGDMAFLDNREILRAKF